MLALVKSYGHNVCLVEENIRCHKCGVGEKTCIDVLCVLLALVLELCHSGKLTEHGIAVKNPAKLCVCRNVGLNEKSVLLFINATSHIKSKCFICSSAKLCRCLTNCNGVKIYNTIESFIFVGKMGEILNCSKIISYGKVSRWLNAGENNFLIA